MFIWKSSYLDTSWRNFRTPKDKEKILKASRGKQNKAVYLQRNDLEWDVPRVSLSLAAGTSGFNLKLYPSSATRVLCYSWASCHEETTPDNFWGPFQLRSAADSCCWTPELILPSEFTWWIHQAAPLHNSPIGTADCCTALCFKGACAFAFWTHADSPVQSSFSRTETVKYNTL